MTSLSFFFPSGLSTLTDMSLTCCQWLRSICYTSILSESAPFPMCTTTPSETSRRPVLKPKLQRQLLEAGKRSIVAEKNRSRRQIEEIVCVHIVRTFICGSTRFSPAVNSSLLSSSNNGITTSPANNSRLSAIWLSSESLQVPERVIYGGWVRDVPVHLRLLMY